MLIRVCLSLVRPKPLEQGNSPGGFKAYMTNTSLGQASMKVVVPNDGSKQRGLDGKLECLRNE